MELRFDSTKFRAMVEDSGISQAVLAERSGTSDRYIRAMSAGEKTNPSASKLSSICYELGRSVEDCMSPVSNTE